jgi:hypothetical protein
MLLLITILATGNTQGPKPPKPLVFVEAGDTGIEAALGLWKKTYPNAWWPWGLTALDYDNDGDQDLVVSQHNGGSAVLRKVGGKFSWVDVGSPLGGTTRPRAWDIDRDGCVDLVYADSTPNTCYFNRRGRFVPMGFQIYVGTTSLTVGVLQGDFNGDGYTDLQGPIVGTPGAQKRYIYSPSTKKFVKSDYTPPIMNVPWAKQVMHQQWQQAPQHFSGWVVEQVELNGDGRPDLYMAGFGGYGGAAFGRYVIGRKDHTAALALPTSGCPTHAGDFNQDGRSDFIIVGQGLYLSTAENRYAKKLGPLTDFVAKKGDYLHRVYQVDFDRDGRPDLVVFDPRGEDTRIYQGLGGGDFTEVKRIWSWNGDPVAIADMDGDGWLDICVGTGGQNGANVSVLLNQSAN